MKAAEDIMVVSLGPGEPELITLKALKTLQDADVIFCPAIKMAVNEIKSGAFDILKALPIESDKIRLYQIPLSKTQEDAFTAYDAVFDDVSFLVAGRKKVSFVVEGDACFYSSVNYLYERLIQAGYPVKMVAGIPAFIAASSSIGLHLVTQQERMLVIPGDVLVDELLESVVLKRILVVTNVSLGEPILRPFIIRHPELEFHYFEKVGTSEEYYASEIENILARPFISSSILMIRPRICKE